MKPQYEINKLMALRPSDIPMDRILINEHGEAVSCGDAIVRGYSVHYVFVRKDGWVLGCPSDLFNEAMELWKDEWIAYGHVLHDKMDIIGKTILCTSDFPYFNGVIWDANKDVNINILNGEM
jgi:hypothetical protein